jgi:hypothetical protein
MFIGQQKQYCENSHITKSDLHIQYNLHQNFNGIFTEKEKILELIWKHKITRKTTAILSKKSNAGGITIPDFKPHCRTIVTKSSMESCNRTTQKVEIGRIVVQVQLGQKVCEMPSQSIAGYGGTCLSSYLCREAKIERL